MYDYLKKSLQNLQNLWYWHLEPFFALKEQRSQAVQLVAIWTLPLSTFGPTRSDHHDTEEPMIAYKTFFTILQGNQAQGGGFGDMERLRQMAQKFINREVGAENVITIAEYTEGNIFYISVWYRGQPR